MDMLHNFDTFFQALELFSNVACHVHVHVEAGEDAYIQ
jgi:hypothetical protein